MDTNNIKIIGLCGLTNSGKDTLANAIVDKFQRQQLKACDRYKSIKIVKFADGIKNIARTYFGMDENDLEGGFKDLPCFPNQKTPRHLLKFIGESFKKFFPSIWVYNVEQKIRVYNRSSIPTLILVTDVRFPEEFDMLTDHHAVLVDVCRKDQHKAAKMLINLFGVNLFTQHLVWLIDNKLSHCSEFNYFKHRILCSQKVNNTELDQGIEQLTLIVENACNSSNPYNFFYAPYAPST